MKKTLSLVLSALLLITSLFSTVMLIPAAADAVTDDLNNAATWYDASINNSGTTITTAVAAPNTMWGTATAVEALETPGGLGKPSVKFNGNGNIIFGKLLTLKANTEYTLSFKYYGENTGAVAGAQAIYFNMGVIPNVTGETLWTDVITAGQWAWCSNKEGKLVNLVGSTDSESYTVGTDVTPLKGVKETWHDFSVKFNSGTATSALLYFNNAVLCNTYISDVKLVAKIDPVADLNDATTWYDAIINNSGTTITTAVNATNTSWGTATAVDALETPGGLSVPSVKFNGNGGIVFGKLLTLKANTEYKLTFKYYGEKTAAVVGAQAIYFNMGVIPNVTGDTLWNEVITAGQWAWCSNKEGKLVNLVGVSDSESYTAGTDVTPLKGVTETWHDFSVKFNSGTATSALWYFNNAVLCNTYIADVKLEENTTAELNSAATWYDVGTNNSGIGTANATTISAANASWGTATAVDALETPGGLGVPSVKFNGNSAILFGKVLKLAPNTDYTFSFKHYGEAVGGVGGEQSVFYNMGIVADVTADTNWSDVYTPNVWTMTTKTEGKLVNFVGSLAEHENNVGTIVSGIGKTKETWYTTTVKFNSGTSTSALWYFENATLTNTYIADVKLTVGDGEEGGGSATINDAAAWTLYEGDTASVGASGTLATSGTKEDNTDSAYIEKGTNSIKVNAKDKYMVTNFAVAKNKDYYVTISYYADTADADGAALDAVAVMKKDGVPGATSDDNLAYVGKDMSYSGPYSTKTDTTNTIGTTVVEENGWNQVIFNFNTGDNTELALVLKGLVDEYYIDDIAFAAGTYVPDVKDYGTPQKEIVIDFENPDLTYSASPTQIDVVSTTGYNGSSTKALHIIPGEYQTTAALNYTSIRAEEDPIYTMPVKPLKVYKLSWRMKIAADSGPLPYFKFITTYKGDVNPIADIQLDNPKQGEWIDYEVTISTVKKQNRIGIYFDASKTPVETWIDDIKLVETEKYVFEGYKGTQDKVEINFDDFGVSLEQMDRMEVTEGPAKDGKTSDALYVKGGNYNDAVYLNWKGTARDYNDPVFKIPVKPNQLYNFSFKLYVPQAEGADYAKIPYLGYFIDTTTSLHYLLSADENVQNTRNEWIELEYQFVTGTDQKFICTSFNASKMCMDMYFDDFVLEEVKPGLNASTNLSYADKQYNALGFEGVESADALACKTSVTKMPVETTAVYTLALTVTGGTAADQVFMSFDGVNPIGKSRVEVVGTPIITGADKDKRVAYQFVTDNSGFVYLVVKNNSGKLKYEDITVFKAYSTSTNKEVGREEDPNDETANEVTDIVILKNSGSADPFGGSVETQSPETGDSAIPPVLMVIISLAAVFALGIFKPSRKESKEV